VCCKNSQRVAHFGRVRRNEIPLSLAGSVLQLGHISAACCKNSQCVAHFGRVRHKEIPRSLGGSVLQLGQRVLARTTTSAPRVARTTSVLHNIWPRVTQRNSTLTRLQRVTIGAACCQNYHISAACCKNYQRVAQHLAACDNEIRLGSVLQEELPTKFDSHSAAACCKNYHIRAACCKNFLAMRAHKTRPGHKFIPQIQLFPRLK
jgi:hypothetical protein